MNTYNVVLHYNNGSIKPYMLTNVIGRNEQEAIAVVHETMIEICKKSGRSNQEIIDAISIQSLTRDPV